MHAFVTSLKYAPGLAKEFQLLGRNLARHGWHVSYLLSQEYAWLMGPTADDNHYVTKSGDAKQTVVDFFQYFPVSKQRLSRIYGSHPAGFLCLYNPHPLNFVFARLAQQTDANGIRSIYLHEPYKPDKGAFGVRGSFYFGLVELFQVLSMKYTTSIILPSPYAKQLFRQRYPNYQGAVHMAPILLPDIGTLPTQPRKYISLIGNINRARGLESFIELINYAADRSENLRFRIVTRSDVSDSIRRLSVEGHRLVEIINKPKIADDELAETVTRSLALFLPHRQVTQSGNVPVAFRSGTPIIATNLPGLAQHIIHRENGFLIPYDATSEQLLEAVHYVQDNFPRLSGNARAAYEETFAEKNWDRHYAWLDSNQVRL